MFTFHQKLKHSPQLISFLLLCALLLAACQSETPEAQTEAENAENIEEPAAADAAEQADATAEIEEAATPVPATEEPAPAPTREPTEVPTEVPTEEPAADFEGAVFASAADGYSIVIPTEYEAIQDGTDVIIPEFSDDPEAYLLFSTDVNKGEDDLQAFLVGLTSNIVGESGSANEPTPISINGANGYSIAFEASEDGTTIKGVFLAVEIDSHAALMFGGGSADYWDNTLESVFNQVVASIQLIPPVEATAETSAEEVSVPAVSASGISGVACMAGKDVGLSCINADGTWSFYNEDNSNLSSNFISAVTACPDDRIVISTLSDINLFDGSNIEVIPGDWGFSSPDEIVCDAAGNIWVIFFDGAGFYDGSNWNIFEFSDFSNDDSGLVSDIAVTVDGTAWILASNSISAYKEGGWTIYDEGNGLDDQYFFNNLGIGADGQPIASYGDGFVSFDGTNWNNMEADSYYGLGDLVSFNNFIWFETLSDGVVQYDGERFNLLGRDSGLSSNVINSMQIDGSGRLWIGTDYGINVVTAEGVEPFTMANSEIADQRVEHLVVLGDGPELPDATEKGTGSISGTVIFEDGSPLADARVELCAESLSFGFSSTPCAEQALFYQTKTDADGNFVFDGVAVGFYVTVIEAKPDEWAQVVGEFGFLAERLLISEGETVEIGEITISQDE